MRKISLRENWKYYALALVCIVPGVIVPSQYVFRLLALLLLLVVLALPMALFHKPSALIGIVLSAAMVPISLIGLPAAETIVLTGIAFALIALPLLERKYGLHRPVILVWAAFSLMLAGLVTTHIRFLLISKIPFSYYYDFLVGSTLLFVIFFIRYPKHWMRIVTGLCIASSALALWCIIFSVMEGDLFRERLGFAGSINPNVLASFLDLTCGIALFAGLNKTNPRKNLYLVMGGLQYASLILTQSRGSLFGVIVVGCVFLWSIRKHKATIIGVIIMAPLLLGLGANRIFGRITSPSINDLASNYGRVMLLESTWTILNRNQFVFGSGMDNFKKEKMSVGFPAWFDKDGMMSSHNAHLEFLLGWGLFGFVGWLLLLGGAIASGFRYSATTLDPTGTGVSVCLISFGLHGMVESLVAAPPFFLTLCVVIGIAYGLSNLSKPPKDIGSEGITH